MRFLLLILSALAFCANTLAAPLQAQPNSLSVTLQLADLPSTIVLCRDPTAIQVAGDVDESWFVGIDTDANPATPGGNSDGIEVIIGANTLQQASSCSPHTANTQSSIVGGDLGVWDTSQQNYVDSGIPVSVALDFTAKTITMTAPLIGPLANMKGIATLYAGTEGVYTATSNGSVTTFAQDNGNAFTTLSSMTDPAGDVSQCSSPCSPSASWYGLVDLLGASATTTAPIATYGAGTVYFEFDMAGLPATMSLCRYPQSSTFSDSQWDAFINPGNTANPAPSNFSTAVFAYTIPQAVACMPNNVLLGQALQAEIDHWDSTQNNYVKDADLPVNADANTGKIIIQADGKATALAGLSTQSPMGEVDAGAYPSGNPQQPFAYDNVSPLQLGTPVSSPSGNVQNCSSPCSTTVSWYPQIDLVGGYIHLADHIFTGDFE
ncbi:MAG: hypothetical protein JSS13_02515 [Proteobacteria bacterium]|nr:hypothetical protein [Pseudomonadota bacterium]